MSAALLFTLPAVVFFLLVQRHIVAGLTAGAVKADHRVRHDRLMSTVFVVRR